MLMKTLEHCLTIIRQLDNAYDQYEWLLDLGIRAPSFPEICQDTYKIPGCKTNIWLEIQCLEHQIQIRTDSDSLLVKGVLSPLMGIHTRESAAEMIHGFLQLLELVDEQVIYTDIRNNGLAQVIRQIQTAITESM